ncbi:MAG: thioesterase family protein [Candidatus Krumholzibacteria bacterium]|nr:thioesterase family protein [Candidatus Krumholzibacteria bacterium]
MVFSTEIKIRGYHLDGYGHVNNARWVELLEEARWRWLDDNLDLAAWDAIDQGIAVVSLSVNYRKPAHMHDRLEFRCWTGKLGGRSAVCRQEAYRVATGERLVDADVTFLLIDRKTGRPRPLAGEVREMLVRYLDDDAPCKVRP